MKDLDLSLEKVNEDEAKGIASHVNMIPGLVMKSITLHTGTPAFKWETILHLKGKMDSQHQVYCPPREQNSYSCWRWEI